MLNECLNDAFWGTVGTAPGTASSSMGDRAMHRTTIDDDDGSEADGAWGDSGSGSLRVVCSDSGSEYLSEAT